MDYMEESTLATLAVSRGVTAYQGTAREPPKIPTFPTIIHSLREEDRLEKAGNVGMLQPMRATVKPRFLQLSQTHYSSNYKGWKMAKEIWDTVCENTRANTHCESQSMNMHV